MSIVRWPVVAFAYLVEQLRRIPGARWVERHVVWVVTLLLVASFVAFLYWGAQRSPQRISLAGLVNGDLSAMQSWIIISGDLERDPLYPSEFRYTLTDAEVPFAKLIVNSDIELPTGQTTISGTVVGGRLGAPTGERWTGQMVADAELAREQDPPWMTIGLAALALLVSLAGRTSYPIFFSGPLRRVAATATAIRVGVRRGSHAAADEPVPGTLVTPPGAPTELHLPGAEPLPLRVHSPHTSVEVGELHRLRTSEPALVVHHPSEELTLSFASLDDRDRAFATLFADVEYG